MVITISHPFLASDASRSSASGGSQQLLVVLIGTYFLGLTKPLPSTFLVRILMEFGITEVAARNVISRVARRGLLTLSKPGRNTFYQLSDSARSRHAARLSGIVNFGRQREPWNRRWTVVAFSVSEKNRAQRHLVRQQLTKMQFGMLYDGVWIAPRSLTASELQLIEQLEVQKLTVFSSAHAELELGQGAPTEAFPLETLQDRYEAFHELMKVPLNQLRNGEIDSATALELRTEILAEWRSIADQDPRLPKELLPVDWSLDRARASFVAAYDGLAELADYRLRTLVKEFAPELADEVRSLSIDEIWELS